MLDICIDSPKFKRFVRTSGLTYCECYAYLDSLWRFTRKKCPTGAIGVYDDIDIEEAINWQGEAGKLIEILIAFRWIDADPEHRLVVHDWPDHCEDAVHNALVRNLQVFCNGQPARTTRASVKDRDRYSTYLATLSANNGQVCVAETTQSDSQRNSCAIVAQEKRNGCAQKTHSQGPGARGQKPVASSHKGGCTSYDPSPAVDNSETVDNSAAALPDPCEHPPESQNFDIDSSSESWMSLYDDPDFAPQVEAICEQVESSTGAPRSVERRHWMAHAAVDCYSDAVGGDPMTALRGMSEFISCVCGKLHPKGFDVAGFLAGLAKYPDRIMPPEGKLSRRCQVLMAMRQYASIYPSKQALKRLWDGIKRREGVMA